ncbi:MAG: CGNR zinc finger domain-containing protein [Candidatus Krumholzibacteria bacterium]|nr:CGNR zinc finger domain-containing protein [Candidatus Krumholzibacteria bacterium]
MVDPFESPWPGAGTGGSTALEFANTLDWRRREPPEEKLLAFPDLLRWARTAGVLKRAEARSLRAWGEAHPRAAAKALARAIEVREAIAAVLLALSCGEAPPPGPLARLDAAYRAASAARTLRRTGGAVAWTWRGSTPAPDRPAWAAALDAARIVTSDERERVRQCCDDECGWLFLDTSRNHSRRWCSMETCGNRNKVRTFYRRAKKHTHRTKC